MDIGELVDLYQQINEERRDLKRAFDEKDRELKTDEERIKLAILGFMQKSGVKSIKTEFGTAYQQEDVIPTGSDWQAFYDWVADNNAFDALERRIKKTFIKEYMETHDGDTPPGVSVLREMVVRIRRT
jgi:hypothetical protein